MSNGKSEYDYLHRHRSGHLVHDHGRKAYSPRRSFAHAKSLYSPCRKYGKSRNLPGTQRFVRSLLAFHWTTFNARYALRAVERHNVS